MGKFNKFMEIGSVLMESHHPLKMVTPLYSLFLSIIIGQTIDIAQDVIVFEWITIDIDIAEKFE